MFRSTAVYTDVASVLRSMKDAETNPMRLSAGATAGNTSISLTMVMPDVTIGSSLLLDINSTSNETVTVTAITGLVVTCSAVQHNHTSNAPVSDVTVLQTYVAPASRFIDDATFMHGGFSYEEVTETLMGLIKGSMLTLAVSKPLVAVTDVETILALNPQDAPALAFNLSAAWVENDYILRIPLNGGVYFGQTPISLKYKGGFSALPTDIVQAATIMAARMYKERNSGYGDAIADSASGSVFYTKAMPADVAAIVQRWKRWTA